VYANDVQHEAVLPRMNGKNRIVTILSPFGNTATKGTFLLKKH